MKNTKRTILSKEQRKKAKLNSAPKRKPKNYLNNADMLAELKLCHAQGKLTHKMGDMFLELVKRYASIPRFSGYSYNDDMRSFALLTLCKVWTYFDATRFSNPFAYFTQIVHNAFFQFDNAERKQRDIRDALLLNSGKNASYSYSERTSHFDENADSYGDYDPLEWNDMAISSEVDDIVNEMQIEQSSDILDTEQIVNIDSQIEGDLNV